MTLVAPGPAVDHESRLPPALAILIVLVPVVGLPDHVHVLPIWVSFVAAAAMLVPMAAVTLTQRQGSTAWHRIERTAILLVTAVYVSNVVAELADMIGAVALHPASANAFSLLTSSVAIWIVNVLVFSLLYWQIDRGGPSARAGKSNAKPDWIFAQPPAPEDLPPGWRPLFLDYLFLSYTTSAAFSPTDTLPITRRAKVLMMIESAISLLTLVVVVSRAINTIPN